MKIAIIGAPDSVKKVYSILSSAYSEINFVTRSTEKIDDMINFIQDIEENVDGFYLTGIGIYSASNEKTNIKKPVVYTKRGITGIVKSFWDFQKDNCGTSILKNMKIGIDVVDEKDFLETLEEFNIKIKSYYLQKYDYQKTEAEYLEEYLKKIKSGEINCVFTAFGYIYSALKEKNIPVYRVQATNSEIKKEFKNLLDRIKMSKAENSKISVEIIKILKSERISNNILSDKLQFEKELLAYSQMVDGNIQTLGNDEYLILSNKGLLNAPENINTILSIIKNYSSKGLIISIGIGEGNTMFLSEKNARIALKISMGNGNNSIFFSDGSEVKGPLMEKREILYKNSSDKRILEISKNTGVSTLYLEKIKSIIKKQDKNSFTSAELAEFLNISERSTNRIIKKIIEAGYASVEFENSFGAGRPRRKTQFNF
ncbi:MAG: HTH domain-containing protein [Fusobacterium sp.]|nr:HTH domain-containing protein [Fusobacterium sp.]